MKSRVFALILKEIFAVLQDKKSRMMLLIPPILQLFVFSFAATLDVKNVSMAIVNRDTGKQSYELIQRFVGSPTFKYITYLSHPEEVRQVVDTQKAVIVMQIDETFSRNLLNKKPATVQLILDGRRSNSAQIVLGYAQQIITQYNQDLATEQGDVLPKSELVQRNWFNPNLMYQWFTVPGLVGVITTLIGMIVTALSIARERELGTFEQLLVSPLKPVEILIGKAVPAIVIGMAEGSIILFAGMLVFQIPFQGSLLLLYLSMTVFITSIVGVGLFISALCSTQQQALLGVFVFMSPAIALSGFATPIENMPQWLQKVTYLNPLRYFLENVRSIFLKGIPFQVVMENVWPMALIALFTLSVSTLFFRRRLG